MNKYLLNDSREYLNTDFEVVRLEDKKTKINEEIDTLIDLYSKKDIPESITAENIVKILKDKDSEIKKIDNVIFELKNKEVVNKIKIEKINTIKILFKGLIKGIEKLNSLEWKRIINRLVDEIGIDSICGYGKTNKLDVYITYNFNNFLEDSKSLHWTSQGYGKGTLGFKFTKLIKWKRQNGQDHDNSGPV